MTQDEKNLTSFPTENRNHQDDWKKYNGAEYYKHPDFGKLPQNAPCTNCVEVLSKRTIDERFFISIQDSSQFFTQKALGDLHQLVDGFWVTIDHRLHPVASNKYESGYKLDQPVFDLSTKRTELHTNNGVLQFNQWKLLVVLDNIDITYYEADWSNYSIGADGLYIHEVFPGIDAEMIVLRGAIKTSFILKSNEFGAFDHLVFREELEGIGTMHAAFSNGTHKRSIGSLKLMSGTTEIALMDEAKLFAKDGPKEIARSAEYEIDSNVIDLIVDYNWIINNIDKYQLVVDPLVTGSATLAQASITGSRYNASCNFTNSCDYNLVVATPANSTITDATFSFTYSANGTTCWLQDGATRIGVGSCTSPSTAGFYWFCNGIGGGTCSANNQTIFPDVSACLPAPSCTPQNVTFTLKFYRSCWGATGCSNTCIGAASPWVMNIIGRTLEYTNLGSPITLSATTICQGGSLTASTSSTGGVPGYSYNWSFSPTGTPSVGTGASASITFPTSGTITLYSIVTDACGNQVTSSRTVTVTPGTPPTVTASGPTTFCAGGSVTLTSSATTGNTWSTGATSQSITVNTSGSYTVSVVSGSCTSTSVPITITVNPLPATPTITASGTTTLCTGGSVTLTSSATTGNTWSTGATTQSITVTTSGSYTVTVSNAGCTSTSAPMTVTVNPTPAAPTITASGPTTFCAGGSVTLTSSAATGNTWSTGATTQSITVTTAGTYDVTFQDVTGCQATSSPITVTVNPLPATPTISVSGPTTFCAGGSVTLTSSTTSGNTWSTGVTTQSITVTTSGSYTVTVSNAGCTSTSAPMTVTVNPLPAIPTISASGPTTFCAGGSVTLTSSATTGNTWSTGATSQSITVTTGGSYDVTIQDVSGCQATSATTNVVVNPLPATPIISASGPTTFCAGGSVTLTSSATSGNTWSTGVTTQSITVTTSGSYTVTVSNAGCTSTSAPMTVTVNPLPATPIISASGPTTFCAGGSVTLTSSATTGNTWSTGATSQSITVTTGGSYDVTIQDVSGCQATSATTNVVVNPLPATPIISASGPTTFCAGGSVTLTSSATSGNTWSTGATTQSIAVTTSGSYSVTVSNAGCSSSSTVTTITVNPMPTVTASNNGPLCINESLDLSATGTSGGVYSWTGPNNFVSSVQNPTIGSISNADYGVYTVAVTVNGCTATASTTLTANTGVSTAIFPTGPFCSNDLPVVLSAVNPGGIWSGTGIVDATTGVFDPAISGPGSYLISYDIPGSCSGASTTNIVVNSVPQTSFVADNLTGCPPMNVNFTNLTPGTVSSQWDFGNGQSGSGTTIASANYLNSGCHTVSLTVTDLNGCSATSTQVNYICLDPVANASFTPSPYQATVTHSEIHFINTSTNATNYFWNFGDGSTSSEFSPTHVFEEVASNYSVILIATNSFGCSDTATIVVRILDELIYFVPNTFTPNGDEHNHLFQPVFTAGFDPYSYRLEIFNRWGETLFISNDSEVGWDGTYNGALVQEGIYTWAITFKDPNTDKKYRANGHVTLIK